MSLLVLLCYTLTSIERAAWCGYVIRRSLTLIGLTNSPTFPSQLLCIRTRSQRQDNIILLATRYHELIQTAKLNSREKVYSTRP